MRIVEIVPQLASGGGERFVVDLCNGLVAMGHQVKLIVSHSLERPGLAFYLPELDSRVEVESMNKRMGVDLGLPFRIRRAIRSFCPDVVHTHLNGIVYAAFRVQGLQYFHTLHSVAEKEAGGMVTAAIRRHLFKTNKFTPVTISNESFASFRDFYGMDAPMIPNGRNVPADLRPSAAVVSEIEGYKVSGHTRVIVNLARIIEVKRQDLIARVCKRLEGEGYDFALLIIGRKGDAEMVRSIEQTVCTRVHMLGERANPLEYLAAADGYCLMSSYEGMPISLIEALGCGAVPVCTPVGGIKNVIDDGINGFLATDLTEDACYVALKRFLNLDTEGLTAMQRAVRASYQPFSMRSCAEKYVGLFQSKLSC